MNTVKLHIKEMDEPYKRNNGDKDYWCVDCRGNSYGRWSRATATFDTKEEAEKLSIGDTINV